MNRISNTKAFRRVGIAAVVGALVVAGAGIAGASTNTNARGVATSTLSARSANHHHGSTKVHPIDGVIYSLSSTNGTLTSMLVTTPKNGNVPVNFGAETVIANGGIVSSLTSASLIAGQHVHVILVPGLTLNAPPTALLVRVQSQS